MKNKGGQTVGQRKLNRITVKRQVSKYTYFQLLDPFSATSSLNCVMGEKLLLVHSRVNLFSDLPAASEFHTGEEARPGHE